MLTYEQQLAQLRQMVGAERNVPSQTMAQPSKDDTWNDVQKQEAEDAIRQREERDLWLEEAGYGSTFLTEDPRWPKDETKRTAMFEAEFSKNPYYIKYGDQVQQMAQELLAQVQDPNSPMDAQQAIKVAKDLLDRITTEKEEDNGFFV